MFALQSCIEEFNAELPAEDTDILVVEGTIISDEVCQFYVSKSVALGQDYYGQDRINATLTIIGSDGLRLDVPRYDNQSYKVKVPKLDPNAEYIMEIEFRGDTYQSDPQKPFPSNPIEAVEYDQPDPHGVVNVLVTTAVPKNPKETQYYRWTYEETWEVKADYRTTVMWDPNTQTAVPNTKEYLSRGWCSDTGRDIIASSSAYYENNQIVKYKLYDISRGNRRFQEMYSTLIKQRSVSKEEYEYENERRRLSQQMGGLFTPQPSVLPTNIHCKTSQKRVIGYIGCSAGYATQRLFIDPSTISADVNRNCEAYYSGDEGFPGDENLYKSGYILFMYQMSPDGMIETGWTSRSCIDVSVIGASAERPPYWIDPK